MDTSNATREHQTTFAQVNSPAPRVYFKNLNGFRFLAASGVIITHIELYKNRMGSPNIWKHPLVFELGSAAVDFFFVLSGFLITYLLLEEKKQFRKINFSMFYLRRILRIWPVYFLVILAAFFVIPYFAIFYTPGYSDDLWVNYVPKLVSCLLIFPNVALEIFGNIPYASPTWSIGVEEQFYIIWPFLIAGSKNLFRAIGLFIVLFIGLKVGLLLVSRADLLSPETFVRIKDLVVATRMECMGIGGLGAWLLFSQSPFLKYLNRRWEMLLIFLVFVVLYKASALMELHHIILSMIFLGIIMHAVVLEKSVVRLETPLFRYLGKLSYGIYMFHTIFITLAYKIFYESIAENSSVIRNGLLYVFSFAFAIGFSALSYKYFESWFLNRKTRFTKVASGTRP